MELQNQLWQQAVVVTTAALQSLPAYRFTASLNDERHPRKSADGDALPSSRRRDVPIAVVIMKVIDLDRPVRGLIQARVQPLIDAQQGIPP